MASESNQGLLFLILQYLEQHDLSETARQLEAETGIYFNMAHFEQMLESCAYNEAESYLCGFTHIDDNPQSAKIYFGIRKLRFLEALADGEREIAREVIENHIESFNDYNEELIQQASELLEMDDFMSHDLLSSYESLTEVRKVMVCNIKKQIEENPVINVKLHFPPLHLNLLRLYLHATAGRHCFDGSSDPPCFPKNDSDQ